MAKQLGYACINMQLRKEKIYTGRSMIRRTFDAKGLDYVSEICIENTKDLIKDNSRKIDEILTILTQGYDLKNHSDSVFSLRVDELTLKHEKKIESLNTKLKRSETRLEQKEEQLEKVEQEFSKYRNTSKEDFIKVINQVFSTST